MADGISPLLRSHFSPDQVGSSKVSIKAECLKIVRAGRSFLPHGQACYRVHLQWTQYQSTEGSFKLMIINITYSH